MADTTSAEAGAARRSSRIAALPKKDDGKVEKPKAARKPAQKRNAEAAETKADDSAPAAKKTKGDDSSGAEASDAPQEELGSLDIGDTLPSLTLKNEKGEDVDVSTLAAENGVIFFLVPKADTPGCTTQACGFRDVYPDFTALDFNVYCLSADTPAAQTKWQTKKTLPYPLLSDPKRVLIRALGAGASGRTQRSHFIFEQGGKLVDKKIPVKPADSPKLALEFVKTLKAA